MGLLLLAAVLLYGSIELFRGNLVSIRNGPGKSSFYYEDGKAYREKFKNLPVQLREKV